MEKNFHSLNFVVHKVSFADWKQFLPTCEVSIVAKCGQRVRVHPAEYSDEKMETPNEIPTKCYGCFERRRPMTRIGFLASDLNN